MVNVIELIFEFYWRLVFEIDMIITQPDIICDLWRRIKHAIVKNIFLSAFILDRF